MKISGIEVLKGVKKNARKRRLPNNVGDNNQLDLFDHKRSKEEITIEDMREAFKCKPMNKEEVNEIFYRNHGNSKYCHGCNVRDDQCIRLTNLSE